MGSGVVTHDSAAIGESSSVSWAVTLKYLQRSNRARVIIRDYGQADWAEKGLKIVVVTQQLEPNEVIGRTIAALLLGLAEMRSAVKFACIPHTPKSSTAIGIIAEAQPFAVIAALQ